MKTYFLIVMLFVSNLDLYSQKTDLKHIPKKTYKITLSNALNKAENFNYLIESLLDKDYTIKQKDDEYGTLKTDLQNIKGLNGSYFLNIRVKDNKIIITGKLALHLSGFLGGIESNSSYNKILNKGMKGSAYKKSFAAMYDFAKSLEYSKIEYEK